MLLGQLLFEPEVVMLLRPVEIDLAGRHGLEGALHSECTAVDMTNDHRNKQNGDNGVYDLRDLHPRDIRHVERKHQKISRDNDGHCSAKGKPKHQLLAGIETPRRRVLRFDEAATLLDPIDVDLLRDVVLNPDRDNQYESDNERGADEIVRVLGDLRLAAERLGSDHWQQQDLAEYDVQAGQAEDHEGYGRQPMRETLEGVKAGHHLPGTPCRNAKPPDNQIGGAQSRDHAKDHDRTEPPQCDFMEMTPLPPGWLLEDALPLVWNIDLTFDAWRLP